MSASTRTPPKRPAPQPASLRIGRHTLSLSNLDKRLYPSGFTKADVVDYYVRIAPTLLPHLAGRAATLKRFPNGADGQFFYEKNCPAHRPEWVRTARVGGREGDGPAYCLIDDPAALVWAANLAALELHVPMARAASPDRPTAMVFDLDPGPPAGLPQCLRLGLRLRDLLAGVGLDSFPKTSGGKGLHVYVPLNTPAVTSDDTKSFARAVATVFERSAPGDVTATMAKAGRAGKVFVDWSQNDRHKTTVCAYSLRARPEPSVSTPISWEEVEIANGRRGATTFAFAPAKVLDRVERLGDLFAPVLDRKQRLPRFGL